MTRSLLVARTPGDPDTLVRGLEQQISAAAPAAELGRRGDLASFVSNSLSDSRTVAGVLMAFAALALLLASLGIYAMVSYGVARRASEIGIRMALGAARLTVIVTVLREVVLAFVVGGGLGLAASLVIARLLADTVSAGAFTPVAVLAGLIPLAGATAGAAYLAARRAVLADPATTLRDQ